MNQFSHKDFIGTDSPSSVARSELEPGEYLLWSARPDAARAARASMLILFFAVPWTAFSLFWMTMAALGVWQTDMGAVAWIFPLFGLPFVAVGLGMLSLPYFVYSRAKRTVYAITDRRAMIIVAGSTRSVESYGPADFGSLKRVERADGTGDLIFLTTEGRARRGSATKRDLGFLAIPDVGGVERIFKETFKASGGDALAAQGQP
jgi:hypothetical protein